MKLSSPFQDPFHIGYTKGCGGAGKFVDSFFRHGGGYCSEGEATIRALEAPRIEAFNGNDGCRHDASFFIRRDLHHRRVCCFDALLL